METISFSKVRAILVDLLSLKSIDAVYNGTHPMFEGIKFLNVKAIEKMQVELGIEFTIEVLDSVELQEIIGIPYDFNRRKGELESKRKTLSYLHSSDMARKEELNKEIHILESIISPIEQRKIKVESLIHKSYESYNALKEALLQIDGLDEESIPVLKDQHLLKLFKKWLDTNFNNIQNWEEVKKRKIVEFENEIEKTDKDIKQLINEYDNEKDRLVAIKSELSDLQMKLKHSDNIVAEYNIKINNNLLEIEKLENTEEFKNKAPYIKRIEELKAENAGLPISLKNEMDKLQTQSENLKNAKAAIETRIVKLKEEIQHLGMGKEKMESEKMAFIKEDITFNRKSESDILDEINFIFGNYENNYFNNIKNRRPYFIDSSCIFKEAFPQVEKVDFATIYQSLFPVFYKTLPSKTRHAFIKFTAYNSEEPDLIKGNNDAAVILFALRNAFRKENILMTKNGIVYLNLGNGIFAKLLIRINKDNIEDDIALYSSDSEQKNVKHLYGGYTKSGYLLNDGIYIITKELIFEIYFEASAFLIPGPNTALSQNISDSEKVKDELERQRLMDLYYDDDDF